LIESGGFFMNAAKRENLGLIGLSHVSLNSKDLPEAERFYTSILGGTKVFDLTNGTTGLRYG